MATATHAVWAVPRAVAGHDDAAELEAAWERARVLFAVLAAERRRAVAVWN
jgi:hypothetical protein